MSITLDQLIQAEGEARAEVVKLDDSIRALQDARNRANKLYEERRKSVEEFIQRKRDNEADRRGYA